MDALNQLLYMMAAAVIGVFTYKIAMGVLPDNALTAPFKRIGAVL